MSSRQNGTKVAAHSAGDKQIKTPSKKASALRLDATNLGGISSIMNSQNLKQGVDYKSVEDTVMGKTHDSKSKKDREDHAKLFNQELKQLSSELNIDFLDDDDNMSDKSNNSSGESDSDSESEDGSQSDDESNDKADDKADADEKKTHQKQIEIKKPQVGDIDKLLEDLELDDEPGSKKKQEGKSKDSKSKDSKSKDNKSKDGKTKESKAKESKAKESKAKDGKSKDGKVKNSKVKDSKNKIKNSDHGDSLRKHRKPRGSDNSDSDDSGDDSDKSSSGSSDASNQSEDDEDSNESEGSKEESDGSKDSDSSDGEASGDESEAEMRIDEVDKYISSVEKDLGIDDKIRKKNRSIKPLPMENASGKRHKRTVTDEQERRLHIASVISDMRKENKTSFGIENERIQDIKAAKLEQIGQLRLSLEEEDIKTKEIGNPTLDSPLEEIDSVLNLLRLKNDSNRYSTLAEEIILSAAEGIETVFDGSRSIPLLGWKPDYTGYHNTVNVKLHRMRFETSQIVGKIIEKYNIGSLTRIALELLPSFFIYPRTQRRQKQSKGLYDDPSVIDSRSSQNAIRRTDATDISEVDNI